MHALMLIYQELAKQKQNKLKLPKAMEGAGFSASMKSIISIIYLTYFKSRISIILRENFLIYPVYQHIQAIKFIKS